MYGENVYKNFEEIKSKLLHKKIVSWETDKIVLDDGTIVTAVESDSDCCAHADGEFKHVTLDAAITDVLLENYKSENKSDDSTENTVTVKILHNLNEYTEADFYADDGNAGYYYSIASLVIEDIHYKVIEA